MIQILTAALLTFLPIFSWADAANLEIVTPKKAVRLSLKELKAKLKTEKVELEDPVYKRKMAFDGFALKDVFQLAGLEPGEAADEVVYTSKDGYSPNMSFAILNKYHGYLVYREHGRSGFERVDQGKTKLSPGPFYVVWQDGAKIEHEVPWPYQLVRIEAVHFAEKYPKLYPKDAKKDSPEYKGFLTFKRECIRCHSINLEGGSVGPELNAPRNVTEYWRSETLKSFIKDASKFRYKDKMPPFTNLSSGEIDEIVSYFQFMAKRKIAEP